MSIHSRGLWDKIDGDRLELGGPVDPPGPGGWSLMRRPDGVAWLILDQPDLSTNRIDQPMLAALDDILAKLEADPPKGLVLRSAKRAGFMVGADIAQFRGVSDPNLMARELARLHAAFDRLEALPFPTVVVAHGHAVGGGLELALACRWRIAVANAQFGFPEVQLGLHPGLGGTARSIRLVGPAQALPLMLTGRTLRAAQARRMGLVDAVVEERHVAAAVRAAIDGKLRRAKSRASDALLASAPGRVVFADVLRSQTAKKVRAAHYPAPFALIDLWAKHGGDLTAMKTAEVASFSRLIVTPQAQNLIRLFFLREGLKGWAKGGGRIERLHVVGAGAMGGDIAAWCALSGLTVTLADISPKALAAAAQRAAKLFERRHLKGKLLREASDRLIPDLKGAGAGAADLVIEAAPEKLELKQKIFAGLEAAMKPEAILATNTSSLRLEDLRASLQRPERLVGVHFFNPVAQMQLVEVISHDQADLAALATAGAFVNQIARLPARVTSAPGFLVNRALMPYVLEAMLMADEGLQHEAIDEAAERFGMPMGPIALADQVGLDICLDVAEILAEGLSTPLPPTPQWLKDKVQAGDLGRKTGRGLYTYAKGKPVKRPVTKPLDAAAEDRLILPMLNACMACLREGVAPDADTVDGAMVFGTGFAPFRGGPMRYAHERGKDDVVAALRRLEAQYGARFTPDAGWTEAGP
ncbi:MAG TPA: 3-hydroxyacyl-CoA dehydrogenase NAD-binding domain-containing protein [Caulobacteraceae bacterium]|nr:3-hydroxyacyl-CoA dehydrogenase NAD-binding domain-containing protein [Caulobacteraceae bacterium]